MVTLKINARAIQEPGIVATVAPCMRWAAFLFLLGCSAAVSVAEPLGWFEQKFSAINFDIHKWSRAPEQGCRIYTALEDGVHVDVLRIGTNNLVAFRATKGLKISVCGSTASFDEGFDALGNVERRGK